MIRPRTPLPPSPQGLGVEANDSVPTGVPDDPASIAVPADAPMPGALSVAAVLNSASASASPFVMNTSSSSSATRATFQFLPSLYPSGLTQRRPSPGSDGEALRKDLLAFHNRHEDALADLIFHLDDGQAVLANCAIVEARLGALLSAAEPLGETEPSPLDDHRSRSPREACRTGALQQVRLRSISRTTLDALLRWGYGEEIPRVWEARQAKGQLDVETMFGLFEACSNLEFERLLVLLRDATLEALDVHTFADVLRESHLRHIPGLKQGCMRFALHHFDELVERPQVFVGTLQEIPEVVSDLFRLGRQWKDEVCDRAMESPRPAPAPPSTFVADFERLFSAARLAEEQGKSADRDCEEAEGSRGSHHEQELVPDCRIAVGEDIYLGHSAVLAARSDFFLAAFTSFMVERTSLLVTLQHVRGAIMPRRDGVLALLYFLYTGKTDRVATSNAIEVLALVGGEQSGEGPGDSGGYLQLHDADTLRGACEVILMGAIADDDDAFLPLLIQAHQLGAKRLKERAMSIAVCHFKDLASRGAFEVLPMPLLMEVLREVSVKYDRLLPSTAKGLRWELSLLPAPDGQLENSYEAVSSPDLSCGAGASGAAGCSEASLIATFDRQVSVRRVRIGVDLTFGDFDAARLNGSKLQYLTASGSWQDAGVSVFVEDGVVREIELPKVLIAKAFRLVRRQRLAVGLLAFE